MKPIDAIEGAAWSSSSGASWTSRAVAAAAARGQFLPPLEPPVHVHPPFPVPDRTTIDVSAAGTYIGAKEYLAAVEAIRAKAVVAGVLKPGADFDLDQVAGGFVSRFPDRDIYYSPEHGAVEIYGAIKAKYDALGGPAGPLGLPITDETATPDGVGRFNDFAGGSIYWTPRTGPMSVRGAIRALWLGVGGPENPELGYPVQDQYRLKPHSWNDPVTEWCRFENGYIAGNAAQGARVAPFAELEPPELKACVRAVFDQKVHESPDNVGLHPPVELVGVGEWQYDFWCSGSRAVGFHIHGFRDNGLATDTDFRINVWLRFDLAWSTTEFSEPTSKSLVASLDWLRVTAEGGLPSGAVISGVSQGIHAAFFPNPPDGTRPQVAPGSLFIAEVPTGALPHLGVIDLLGFQIAKDGGLRMYVNPLNPPDAAPGSDWGILRSVLAQTEINLLKLRLLGA